jgi:hypothetical protein
MISYTFAVVNFEYRSKFQTILPNCPWFVRIAYTQDSNKKIPLVALRLSADGGLLFC